MPGHAQFPRHFVSAAPSHSQCMFNAKTAYNNSVRFCTTSPTNPLMSHRTVQCVGAAARAYASAKSSCNSIEIKQRSLKKG